MTTKGMNQVIQHLRKVLLQDGTGMTDGQLLACFIEHRDEAAFAALVKRHGPMVWGVCRRLLSHHDAEDAFQAAFLVLVSKAASIRPKEMLANWLYGVAHHTALHSRRAVTRRRTRERQVTHMPEPAVAKKNLWHDLQLVLDQELSRLPDKYRVAIVVCDLEGKTRKEAARQLGCPEGTLAARLARARTMLARRLARHGLGMSGGALAAALTEKVASAGVPTSVMFSTIKAASTFAAGKAAGLISVKVATLTEGVLKAMLLTKIKVATIGLLVVATFCSGAGLIYQVQATEQASTPTAQTKKAGESNDVKMRKLQALAEALETENNKLTAQVQKLQSLLEEQLVENSKLKQQQVRKGKADDANFAIKVYPVEKLTQINTVNAFEVEGKTADRLMKVIVKTIEPTSWHDMGGSGSIEYLPSISSLVIRQSPNIHKKVQDLLDLLGKTQKVLEEKWRKEEIGGPLP
jgi:RNA polymerase sigma factor (sigma-70 family)